MILLKWTNPCKMWASIGSAFFHNLSWQAHVTLITNYYQYLNPVLQYLKSFPIGGSNLNSDGASQGNPVEAWAGGSVRAGLWAHILGGLAATVGICRSVWAGLGYGLLASAWT